MYDLICDVISCCDWSCDMGIWKNGDEKKERKENMEIEEMYT